MNCNDYHTAKDISLIEHDKRVLACPECGLEYLHHEKLLRFTSNGDIEIQFSCEQCETLKILIIHQHKGATLIGWQESKEQKTW